MRKSYRNERLNELLKELISELLLTQIKDPRIGLVTITAVSIAPDLESAKVYFSVMGGPERRTETKQGLVSAKKFLRKAVGRELKLRHSPDLIFVYDDSLERAIALEEQLRKLHEEGRSGGES